MILRLAAAVLGSLALAFAVFWAIMTTWTLHDAGWEAVSASKLDLGICLVAGVGGASLLIAAAGGAAKRYAWALLGALPAAYAAAQLLRS